MGQLCCGPQLTETDKAALLRDKILDNKLKVAQVTEERKVKMLLLGAGESGKSTLFKQMRINFKEGYNNQDLLESRPIIWRNIIDETKNLLTIIQAGNIDKEGELDDANHRFIGEGHSVQSTDALSTYLGTEIKKIWKTKAARQVWEERSRHQILDSIEYYIESIDRIANSEYQPTVKDFLLSRVRSTGMIEQNFKINQVEFVILDVGGQRSERRKWIQCFDNVTAIIFVAAVSEFDQMLYEDTHVNRMVESVNLFRNTLNFKVFRDTPIILFLNKLDLFERKIKALIEKGINFDVIFPELKIGTNYHQVEHKVLEHIKGKFESLAKPGRIYSHYVTATDTDNVKRIFNSTVEIVLSRTLNHHFATQ